MAKQLLSRILASETVYKTGQEIILKGWVERARVHGKLVFIDLRDRSGVIQAVVNNQVSPEAFIIASDIKSEYAVELIGKVNKRPEGAVNKDLITGTVEIEVSEIRILSKSETLPFDISKKELHLELPTLLDHRPLTLKHPRQRAIFKVQEELMNSFREAARKIGCTEIFIPTIAPSATEGGAEVFRLDYYGHPAYLIQSPQLYKQIMVGIFERVSVISHAYRSEPSVTTRHLAEVIQMDCEIGFINDFSELMDAYEFIAKYMVQNTYDRCKKEISEYNIDQPLVPDEIPRLKLREAQEIIFKRTGRDCRRELDLTAEDEKEIWLWAQEEKKSDFITITHFPTKKRAFYTYPDPENPEYSLSYDLIYKGLEILSGSQRINDYNQIIGSMKSRKIDPSAFNMYLQAFKYGMPPEGGFSFGLERITMKILNLSNVREASLFPRDMERIDERFAVVEKNKL